MNTRTIERERVAPPETPPPLVHTWVHPASRYPQPGDKALCGVVKVNPYNSHGMAGKPATCVVCAELKARRR